MATASDGTSDITPSTSSDDKLYTGRGVQEEELAQNNDISSPQTLPSNTQSSSNGAKPKSKFPPIIGLTEALGSISQLVTSRKEKMSNNDAEKSPGNMTLSGNTDGKNEQNNNDGAVGHDTRNQTTTDGAASSIPQELMTKPLNEVLSDAGTFAYVSLCAISASILYEDNWHKEWKEKTVRAICKHMKLRKQAERTMLMFLQEELEEEHCRGFVETVKQDERLVRPQAVPQDLVAAALESGQYDARMRVMAFYIAKLLGVDETDMCTYEDGIVKTFVQSDVELSEEEKKEKEDKDKKRKVKRYLLIGAAAVGGGALIGLTGGLAAPLIASAGAALFGTSLGFLGTTAGLAIIGSVFGAAGAGLTGFKMKKRVGELEEFEFETLTEGRDLHITLTISGWLTKEKLNNFSDPWITLASSKEVYTLRWESKYLLELGEALEYILNSVMTMAAKEALKYTVLAGLLAAFALPATAYASLTAIDNPWSLVTNRAAEAGKQLAEVLLSRQQGKRPVTLIGFSMGARVIFFCLKEMATRKGCEGIIQDAILLGAPAPSGVKHWEPFSRVVAGRIINGYCRGDWLLQFVYRTASVQVKNIAGLSPIEWKDRRMMNIDLTDLVDGHFDYSDKMDQILEFIGIKTKERRGALYTRSAVNNSMDVVRQHNIGNINTGEEVISIIDAKDLLIHHPSDKSKDSSQFIPKSESLDAIGGRSTQPNQASHSMPRIVSNPELISTVSSSEDSGAAASGGIPRVVSGSVSCQGEWEEVEEGVDPLAT